MKTAERVDISKIALNIVRDLDPLPVQRRFEILALVNTWVQIEAAREKDRQQAPPVKDENYDA